MQLIEAINVAAVFCFYDPVSSSAGEGSHGLSGTALFTYMTKSKLCHVS